MLCWPTLRDVLRQEIKLSCEKAVASIGTSASRIAAASIPEIQKIDESPAEAAETLDVGELRSRHDNMLRCFYVQSGKKLHLDRTCCGMSRPREVVMPVAASQRVAWCHRCAQDRSQFRGS